MQPLVEREMMFSSVSFWSGWRERGKTKSQGISVWKCVRVCVSTLGCLRMCVCVSMYVHDDMFDPKIIFVYMYVRTYYCVLMRIYPKHFRVSTYMHLRWTLKVKTVSTVNSEFVSANSAFLCTMYGMQEAACQQTSLLITIYNII